MTSIQIPEVAAQPGVDPEFVRIVDDCVPAGAAGIFKPKLASSAFVWVPASALDEPNLSHTPSDSTVSTPPRESDVPVTARSSLGSRDICAACGGDLTCRCPDPRAGGIA